MTRCFSLAVLAAVLLAAPAGAQITFTFDDLYDFADSGETVTRDLFDTGETVSGDDQARIDALIALRGQGQTWDFTTITYPVQIQTNTTVYLDGDVAGLPGASNFPGANYVLFNEDPNDNSPEADGYVYAIAENNQYVTQGIYVAASGGTPETVITYEPDGLQQLTFPLTFGTVVEDQTTQTVQGFTITTDYRSEVVGSGTLVTPAGSFETLMIEYRVSVSVPGAPATVTDVYSWATRDRFVTADATNFQTPQGPRAYNASYTSNPGGGIATEADPATLDVAVVPNPSQGAPRIALQTARAATGTVTVYDALGREVARLHDGPLAVGTHDLAVEAPLAPGAYLVRVALDGQVTTARLTVVR